MKTTTTKLSVLAFLGLGIAAYGQYEGKVGINTDKPKASLEIKSISANSSDTREGLLIPRVSKNKALLMGNNTTHPVEESTLIYVNDLLDYTAPPAGPDAKVADITEKGYYFWNGTKWVKSVGATNGNTGGALWAQRENNGFTETYLVPADDNGDYIGYANGAFSKYLTSSSFDLNNTTSEWWGFNDASYFVDANHINNANNTKNEVRYQAQFRGIYTDNTATRDIRFIKGGTNVATIGDSRNGSTAGTPLTSVNVGSVLGFQSRVDNYTSGTVGTATGNDVVNSNFAGGHVNDMYGTDVLTRSYGTTVNSYGIRSRTQLKTRNASSTDYIYGGYFGVYAEPNTTINKSVQGLRNDIMLENATASSNFNHGIRNIFTLKSGSTIGRFEGVSTTFYGESGSTIGEYIGYRLLVPSDNKSTITDMYGLYLEDINKGTGKNYAIYTKAGAVRFGDLAGTGTRAVFADADGKLVIGSGAFNSGLWSNDATNNLVKLTNKSDGTTARTDANRVTIGDDGKITAKGFVGYNGAGIFPDYVFQKYYTGESTIKADYTFNTLEQVEHFVKQNGHLPGYTSAKEIAEKGLIDLGATQLTNVEKIEELYLHTIEQEKALKAQKEELQAKDAKISDLEARITRLEQLLAK